MLLDVQETERLLREAGVAVDAPQVAEALQRLRAACRVEQDG